MRLFYCPKHHRTTEFQYEYNKDNRADCPYCTAWFYKIRKFSAKRSGES